MYTIVRDRNKYIAYDENGKVIIISHNSRIVKHQAKLKDAKRVNKPIDD